MGWSLLPNALRPFKIYCAPPNLGITRTWMCWLNFAQRPIFSGLRFFNEPKISDSGSPSLKSLPEDLCSGFLCPEKIHRLQSNLSPRTLDLEASRLPRDHRGRLKIALVKFELSRCKQVSCDINKHHNHYWNCLKCNVYSNALYLWEI